MDVGDELARTVVEVIAPLVWADDGELYVVTLSAEHVTLHLGGRFSGCPGTSLVCRELLEPALRKAAPDAAIRITSGRLVPSGGKRLNPSG